MATAEARARETEFRSLVPINRFTQDAQERLQKLATVRRLAAGQLVYARDVDDGLAHYLVEGELDLFDHGRLVRRLAADQRIARRPLDSPGRTRFTARAGSSCAVLAIPRVEVERFNESTRLSGAGDDLAVDELALATGGDWMARVMASALFQVLPADTIQAVFGALEALEVAADEYVVRQDEPGTHFFLLESGYCEVVRHAGARRQEVHVTDLRPGDTFGEAALISGAPRDASVVALTDSRVMRLPKAAFERLVQGALVQGVPVDAAFAAVRDGARWLDVGDPEVYAKAPLRNSRNIPLNALRVQSARLAREDAYIVCCDDPSQSAVGAYILAERGFRARFLSDPIVMALSRDASAPTWVTAQGADNVLSFPVATDPAADAASRGQGNTKENRPMSDTGADSIPERTDRLFTQEEFEAAVRAQGPAAPGVPYAETQTGQTLARLLEDIDARKAALEREPDTFEDPHGVALDDGATEFIDFTALEATATAVARPAAAVTPPAPPLDGDPVSDLMHDLEHRLRTYVEANLLERTLEVERRYQAKVQKLQQQAQSALRKRDAELKERYAAHYRKKDQQLRDNYQKLMALATRISQQKAQLQATRRQMEEKLQAANAVYRQVEDMRRLLGENIGVADSVGTPNASRLSAR
ncbi:MAG: cyclic nucleotide-binding domain-containing protein [Gammaproteobacteria bacterium]